MALPDWLAQALQSIQTIGAQGSAMHMPGLGVGSPTPSVGQAMQAPGLTPGSPVPTPAQAAGGGMPASAQTGPTQAAIAQAAAQGAQAAGATAGGGAAPAGPVAAQGAPQGGSGGSVQVGNPNGANMVKYPTSNPQFALQSAMLDMGMNPYRANPFMAQTMKLAPALAQSFMINSAGNSADNMAARGGEGSMFADYLRSALGGGGGASLTDPIRNATSHLPDVLRQIHAQQDALAAGSKGGGTAGPTLADTNPLMAALSSIYDDPQGAAGAYGSLMTPFMSSGVGGSYQNALGNVAGAALRRQGNDYGNNIDVPNFWSYLFPNT